MLLAFLVGAVAGVAVALLYAPATGREVREFLGDKARGMFSLAGISSMSERRDWGVLVSPPFLAERQMWMIAWSKWT